MLVFLCVFQTPEAFLCVLVLGLMLARTQGAKEQGTRLFLVGLIFFSSSLDPTPNSRTAVGW